MDDQGRDDDDFWNLLARYAEAPDREALRDEYPAELFDRVDRHYRSCPSCQAHEGQLAERARERTND